MAPKTDRGIDEQASFFSSFSRHCLLYWLYVEFRSLLIHCLLPLAHLWLPLAPFWLPLGIFWVLFGAIWFTFAHPMVLFSHFGISQPSVIFYILLYFQRKSYRRQGFSCKLFIARWRERGFAALKIIDHLTSKTYGNLFFVLGPEYTEGLTRTRFFLTFIIPPNMFF